VWSVAPSVLSRAAISSAQRVKILITREAIIDSTPRLVLFCTMAADWRRLIAFLHLLVRRAQDRFCRIAIKTFAPRILVTGLCESRMPRIALSRRGEEKAVCPACIRIQEIQAKPSCANSSWFQITSPHVRHRRRRRQRASSHPVKQRRRRRDGRVGQSPSSKAHRDPRSRASHGRSNSACPHRCSPWPPCCCCAIAAYHI
jgi:hypothetical protein